MADILKVWRHIRTQTPSIDAYLRESQSCQISSHPDLKQRSLRLFEELSPQQKQLQQDE